MAPSARMQSACGAMKELGIPENKTKPMLKKLLKLYERNWKLIEDENYRVLADSIFEDEEAEEITEDRNIPDNSGVCQVGNVLEQEPVIQEEPEQPLKRLRRGRTTSNAGPSTVDVGNALKDPKPEPKPVDEPQGCGCPHASQNVPRKKKKGKKPMTSETLPCRVHGTALNSKGKGTTSNWLIIPKDEPCTDTMTLNAAPLDVICPGSLLEAAPTTANGSSQGQENVASPARADRVNENMKLAFSAGMEQNALAITIAPDKSLSNGEFTTSSLDGKETTGGLDIYQSLVAFEQKQVHSDDRRICHDPTDITRGEERVKISLVNESQRNFMPSFRYIRQNVIYSDANVKSTFCQINDGDCCQTCYGNCLSASKQQACVCARGEGFAYTSEGLLKEEFLEECIAKVRNPQKHDIVLCSTCPLEKFNNEEEPCRGHVKRTFIKECWVKCGCSKICANRVVQRGVTCKLQVFWSPEGKGWGLRTLEELPRGAFVCEYVGEVLTINERHQRSMQCTIKHSFPVVLDSGWNPEDLQDNQSLCLDLTFYGNVAKFINHRCLDANLVEVPVQVETSDRHYYHVALFTCRKIDAMEELTWDYGLEFDDQDPSLNEFNCLCGSKFCRNMKRSSSRV